MVLGHVPRLAERDRPQQLPERIAAGEVVLAPPPTQAEALVHALDYVLLVLARGPLVQVVAGQLQQVAEVTPQISWAALVCTDELFSGPRASTNRVTEPR